MVDEQLCTSSACRGTSCATHCFKDEMVVGWMLAVAPTTCRLSLGEALAMLRLSAFHLKFKRVCPYS